MVFAFTKTKHYFLQVGSSFDTVKVIFEIYLKVLIHMIFLKHLILWIIRIEKNGGFPGKIIERIVLQAPVGLLNHRLAQILSKDNLFASI